MSLDKDSLANTFVVAIGLCLGCSLLVSSAAVGLKKRKNDNVALDRKSNILTVTGFSKKEIDAAGGVEELFEQRFTSTIIDLNTGEEAVDDCKLALDEAKKVVADVMTDYDQLWASKSKRPAVSDPLSKSDDIAQIKYREKFSHVFILKSESGEIEKYVFPVRGYGLWSMMKGYVAVEPDFQTLAGITFYEHGETPGLGGEIQNPNWKSKWPDKKIFDDGNVAFKVSKGDQSGNEYGVDALSGATITSNGVSKMMEFWFGPSGFGPYIELQKSKSSQGKMTNKTSQSGGNRG